jgi:hypothetical protein
MSLHDIDKKTNNRGQSALNAEDQLLQRKAHNTMSTSYKQEGSVNPQRIAFKNSLILYYDDQNRVIRVDGFIPEVANYPVTIIAKYGYDVFVDILGITAPVV